MKKLTRIRLINWHYFINETIELGGSCLISGKNASGKSTILDAISLVLTVNTRKFNMAANEKSKRNLTGYVRCKTGDDSGAFVRQGNVISYVALEFYEEKTGKFFTLGAYLESIDEARKTSVKWYKLESGLDDIKFMEGKRPAKSDEFRCGDRKVKFISKMAEAKQVFGKRLGRLDDRFFTMIPKSLAFKPMDKVKDFINNFILDEKLVEIESLKSNINRLKELEDTMSTTKTRIGELTDILIKYDDYLEKQKALDVNDLLIKYAEVADKEQSIISDSKKLEELDIKRKMLIQREKNAKYELESATEQFIDLETSIRSNDEHIHITELNRKIEELNKQIEDLRIKNYNYKSEIEKSVQIVKRINEFENTNFSPDELKKLLIKDNFDYASIVSDFDILINEKLKKYNKSYYKAELEFEEIEKRRTVLKDEINNLNNKKLVYPKNTVKLKKIIEDEFKRRNIESTVRIFSELLEISDKSWQNAIEAYLNNQRFYLIVEPKYYDIALHTYYAHKSEVERVGLVNTCKLKIGSKVDRDSLAYLVTSNNEYAESYANFLLGRVKKSESVDELKNNRISITRDCMLYKNFAVRKLAKEIYRTPYIGLDAYKKQLKIKKSDLECLENDRANLQKDISVLKSIKDLISSSNVDVIKNNINVPLELSDRENKRFDMIKQLEIAKDNPTIIKLKQQQIEFERLKLEAEKKYSECKYAVIYNKRDIEDLQSLLSSKKDLLVLKRNELKELEEDKESTVKEARLKYDEISKKRSYSEMVRNYYPQRAKDEKNRDNANKLLIKSQANFTSKYQLGYPTGARKSEIKPYYDEHYRLEKSEIIKYEKELAEAMRNCEMEFKDSFLAELKENIELAKSSFKQLNRSLNSVYYGDDSYRFLISENKSKSKLYKMIMSENNVEGFTIWSSTFEEEYSEEMKDLFDKLLANDDKGDKVIKEYTDYRSYLDYDIEVVKRDGSKQKFSKTYGEKSGGETQTPYYVAIAASFAGLYRLDDSIRLMLLDEAFNRMDEERISAMIDFLLDQKFQIILATPPEKIEVIGEKMDTIVLPIRKGSKAVITKYDM